MNGVGDSSKSKTGAVRDTVESPSPPAYGAEEAPTAIDPALRPGLGVRSGERVVVAAPREGCLARDEVLPYLRRGCSRDLRARVEGHIVACRACERWVRHIGDEILDYIGGQLSEEELARMDAHLDACNSCRDLVHHVVQGMAQSFHGEGHDSGDPGTTFLPGNVVNGRYMVLSFVGRGGMGEVYEVFDQLMDRRIALKTVLCTVADRPRAARRFKEEVRNAQRVGHRHVCRINDLQEHRETMFGTPLPFFTMEFIDGERLGHRLATGPLPLDEVRAIAVQLLGGLEAAHARGVLHLDFKSDNVMLRRDSESPDAVIMDFGLSRVLGRESRLCTSDRRQFAGTLPYMSVEQLEGREALGPTTDVYAFGVVLYEMLARALPFDGDSIGAVLLKQLKERPKPPSHHIRTLSPELDQFVLTCLHANPRLRYANAGEALAALQAVRSWTRPPLGTRLTQSMPWVAGAIGLGIVAVSSLPRTEPPALGSAAPPGPIKTTRALEPSALRPAPERPLSAPAAPAVPAPASPPPPLTPPPSAPAPSPPARAPAPPGRPASSPLLPVRPQHALRSAVASAAAAADARGEADVAVSAGAAAPAPAPTADAKPAPEVTWKPLHVPRRLSVPVVPATTPAPTP